MHGALAQLADKRQFESWLSTLYQKKWVVYAQGPPTGVEGAEAVLKYLARYVSGRAPAVSEAWAGANSLLRPAMSATGITSIWLSVVKGCSVPLPFSG